MDLQHATPRPRAGRPSGRLEGRTTHDPILILRNLGLAHLAGAAAIRRPLTAAEIGRRLGMPERTVRDALEAGRKMADLLAGPPRGDDAADDEPPEERDARALRNADRRVRRGPPPDPR